MGAFFHFVGEVFRPGGGGLEEVALGRAHAEGEDEGEKEEEGGEEEGALEVGGELGALGVGADPLDEAGGVPLPGEVGQEMPGVVNPGGDEGGKEEAGGEVEEDLRHVAGEPLLHPRILHGERRRSRKGEGF